MANPSGIQAYPSLYDRLMANTVILPWSGCYIYMGPTTKGGYCKIPVRVAGQVKNFYVHRIIKVGTAKRRTEKSHPLRHTCHVPCCWNPAHLIPGTPKQNIADQIHRGTKTNGWLLMHENRRQQKHLQSIRNEIENER